MSRSDRSCDPEGLDALTDEHPDSYHWSFFCDSPTNSPVLQLWPALTTTSVMSSTSALKMCVALRLQTGFPALLVEVVEAACSRKGIEITVFILFVLLSCSLNILYWMFWNLNMQQSHSEHCKYTLDVCSCSNIILVKRSFQQSCNVCLFTSGVSHSSSPNSDTTNLHLLCLYAAGEQLRWPLTPPVRLHLNLYIPPLRKSPAPLAADHTDAHKWCFVKFAAAVIVIRLTINLFAVCRLFIFQFNTRILKSALLLTSFIYPVCVYMLASWSWISC